jgi:hypothetical protein
MLPAFYYEMPPLTSALPESMNHTKSLRGFDDGSCEGGKKSELGSRFRGPQEPFYCSKATEDSGREVRLYGVECPIFYCVRNGRWI